jgi:uncharacterized protein (DUF58 family)
MLRNATRGRMLAIAAAVLAALAIGVASAAATSGTSTANGFQVNASLSPDTAQKDTIVTARASVKNVSNAVERVGVILIGPAATSAPVTFTVSLEPGATFSKSFSFPAGILKKGTDRLIVGAANLQTRATAQATASIVVN